MIASFSPEERGAGVLVLSNCFVHREDNFPDRSITQKRHKVKHKSIKESHSFVGAV